MSVIESGKTYRTVGGGTWTAGDIVGPGVLRGFIDGDKSRTFYIETSGCAPGWYKSDPLSLRIPLEVVEPAAKPKPEYDAVTLADGTPGIRRANGDVYREGEFAIRDERLKQLQSWQVIEGILNWTPSADVRYAEPTPAPWKPADAKPGDYVKLRNGDKHKIKLVDDVIYSQDPSDSDDPHYMYWHCLDGRFCEGRDDEYDIIAPWSEPPAKPVEHRYEGLLDKVGYSSGIATDLCALAQDCQSWAIAKQFAKPGEPRHPLHLLALVTEEIGEAVGAVRDGNPPCSKAGLERISSLGEEIADAIVRLLQMAAELEIDIGEAFVAKMKYNYGRPIKHGRQL